MASLRVYVLYIPLVFVFSLFVANEESLRLLGYYYLAFPSIIIMAEAFILRRLSLLAVWQFAFLYIIVSELLVDYDLLSIWVNGDVAAKYVFMANALVVAGYSGYMLMRNKHYKSTVIGRVCSNDVLLVYFVIATILVMVFMLPLAVTNLSSGRDTNIIDADSTATLLRTFVFGLGMVLPAIIAKQIVANNVQQKNSLALYFLAISLLFVLLATGTRYYFLFGVGGFLVVLTRDNIFNLSSIRMAIFALVLGIVAYSAGAIKEMRGGGVHSYQSESSYPDVNLPLLTSIGSMMSPEGVIRQTANLITYTEINDHTYGKAMGFPLYFWVPRSWWSDKPVMTGYWIVRHYEDGFSEGHSSSVGFFGDPYVDFGYFAFLIVFIYGIILAKIQTIVEANLLASSRYVDLCAIAYPLVFFFVRSPVTTLTTFVFMLIAWFFFNSRAVMSSGR
ncbi:MAG: oligosaccharide repeat unit polymerase [Dechloromonas sp.]|nr:oligosaccharide repeat unit polymerase [Dechloromonas sp.]